MLCSNKNKKISSNETNLFFYNLETQVSASYKWQLLWAPAQLLVHPASLVKWQKCLSPFFKSFRKSPPPAATVSSPQYHWFSSSPFVFSSCHRRSCCRLAVTVVVIVVSWFLFHLPGFAFMVGGIGGDGGSVYNIWIGNPYASYRSLICNFFCLS